MRSVSCNYAEDQRDETRNTSVRSTSCPLGSSPPANAPCQHPILLGRLRDKCRGEAVIPLNFPARWAVVVSYIPTFVFEIIFEVASPLEQRRDTLSSSRLLFFNCLVSFPSLAYLSTLYIEGKAMRPRAKVLSPGPGRPGRICLKPKRSVRVLPQACAYFLGDFGVAYRTWIIL